VLRHQPVRELLNDPRLQSSFTDFLQAMGVTSGPFYEWMAISPLNRDGADHQRWRALMSRTFTPRSVERLRPFLRRAAHELIDAFAPRGRCEFMDEFADAFPSLGLCELIGVPREDRERFRAWANAIGLGFNPMQIATRIGERPASLHRRGAGARRAAGGAGRADGAHRLPGGAGRRGVEAARGHQWTRAAADCIHGA
jgi:cytochrome P450